MDTDIQYFQAVIDCANLIITWTKNGKEDIRRVLSSLEMNLEAKYGPFTSKLSNQIGINETLGLKNPDSYWRGVSDTLNLIKNFLSWKDSTNSSRTIQNFLLEIINKSNLRIVPDESPLISALGISFESEFSDAAPILDQETFSNPVEPDSFSQNVSNINSKGSFSYEEISRPEQVDINPDSSIDLNQSADPVDEYPDDKEFDSKEFINDDKFLDQFIADSINPDEKNSENTDFDEAGRDYLRSALAELTESENLTEESDENDVQIQIRDVQPIKKNNQQIFMETEDNIDENLDAKEKSKLLSSSLRDALRMLREED